MDEMVYIACRCKDCIYSEPRDVGAVFCKYWHRRVKEEHFCREADMRKKVQDGKID